MQRDVKACVLIYILYTEELFSEIKFLLLNEKIKHSSADICIKEISLQISINPVKFYKQQYIACRIFFKIIRCWYFLYISAIGI